MNNHILQARLDSLEGQVGALKKQFEEKERRLRTLQDIEDIKRLQCAHGYYLEHWMSEEIIDCFSNSPEVSGTFVEGTYKGLEGIRKYLRRTREVPPEFLHMVMQASPIITVEPDGKRALGRWYGNVLFRTTTPLNPAYMMVIYEWTILRRTGSGKS